MKHKNLKISTVNLTGVFVLVLLLLFCFEIIVASTSTTRSVSAYSDIDSYTVCTDDGYYSETTYYLKESAYTSHLSDLEENLQAQSTTATSGVQTTSVEHAEEDFVIAASKRVWVSETADENGVVLDSRLLAKSEIEQMKSEASLVANDRSIASVASNEEIGSDSESMHYLDIDMTVYYDSSAGQYLIEGNAYWGAFLVGFWQTDIAAEESYLDYIGITWGGEETLCAIDKSITGKYHNNNLVTFSRAESNSYAGFVWQFHEKSGLLGKELEKATASVTLEKEGALKGKNTRARMTYIHTYGAINGSISIEADTNGTIAASVSLSETEKQWQIEIDVPKIAY